MNRKEAIEKLKNIRNVPSMFIDGVIKDLVEALEKPLTLADLLGWEEGVEYEADGHKFRIKNDSLIILERNDDYWGDFDYAWDIQNVNWLRQAKKIEKKLKAYHVKDKYSYNELMKELEEQGYTTKSGTKLTEIDYWWTYKQKTVIYCKEDKSIAYSQLSYYESGEKNHYDLIEYYKKPKLKAYHVKDEYSYKCLMKELEEQGYMWSFDEKATDVSYRDISKFNPVIYCHENKTLRYSSLDYFNGYRKSSCNLIEYHKEEPKYYAEIKVPAGIKTHSWLKQLNYDNTVFDMVSWFQLDKCDAKTKTEWNKLGINDTNADFERVV